MNSFADKRLVLIDTAGMSQHDAGLGALGPVALHREHRAHREAPEERDGDEAPEIPIALCSERRGARRAFSA